MNSSNEDGAARGTPLTRPGHGTTRRAMVGLLTAGLLTAAGVPAMDAHAQAWPTRPLQLVVPFPAGGPPDILARTVAEFLTRDLGQAVVVSNRAGADTIIGTDSVAKAARDGYTMLVLGDSGVINSASGRKLPYDLKSDLIPVSMMLSGPQVVLVAADSRFKTLGDLVGFARAHPGKVSFGSSGAATAIRISTEVFNAAAGIDALHVPYKGVTPALNDIIGGRVDYIITGMSVAVRTIQGGKVRALAVNAPGRVSQLPNVPTAREQGVNVDTSGWYGLFMTAGSPDEAVERMHGALTRAAQDATVRSTLSKLGGAPRVMKRSEFASFVNGEVERIGGLMKRLDIKID